VNLLRKPALRAALVASALAGCTPGLAAPGVPTASPSPGAATSPAAPAPGLTPPPDAAAGGTSLAGKWVTGTADEPAAGPVKVELTCGYARYPAVYTPSEFNYTTWQIAQAGDVVTLTTMSDHRMGPTCPQPACPDRGTTAEGTYREGKLRLTGTYVADTKNCADYPPTAPAPMPVATNEAVTFDLAYDATSGHLRGTRNGQPFWAAPIQEVGPPPPSACTEPIGLP
jgi:hypothetical protein